MLRFSDIRFTIERLLLRGLHYRLILAAAIVAFVAISAGLLALLLDPNFEDVGAAVWWSFLRLTDPGYLGDDEGVVGRSISTVVTVLGYIVFLGLLIAILTQWMNALILRVESGTTRVAFKNHILILGWNHRTPSIVLELLQTGGRVLRFLESSGSHNLRVVILAEQVDAELREELKSSLGARWDDRYVVLRSGSPLKLDGLERAAFHDAAAVILPGADFATARPGVADAEVIKTLASISHAEGQAEQAPLAVAALYNAKRGDVARRAYCGELEVVAADQIISRLMAQCTLQCGLWPIYWELFSLNQDNALFVRELDGEYVTEIGQARLACPKAVVIGVIPSKTGKPILNPPSDMRIKSGDALIFIAKHFADCRLADVVAPTSIAQMPAWHPVASDIETVLILGWSRKVPQVLAELLSHQQKRLSIDVVGTTPADERESLVDSVAGAQLPATVRHAEKNFLDPDVLAEIHPGNYDAVLMIARERLMDEEIADAATLSTYLTVDTLLTGSDAPHVVAEVLDEENAVLFDGDHGDAIVSPMIVGYILSQVALKRELGLIFQELTQSGGTTIMFRSLDPGMGKADCRFSELAAQAAARGETAIGVVTSSAGARQTRLNPGADARWGCEEIEQVIVL
ncbi:MAG: hypothetical protein U9Q19_03585, partial [Pseudomonadota bacterium]|nr:hypothetical protein [Pseudomonadota bacterium]